MKRGEQRPGRCSPLSHPPLWSRFPCVSAGSAIGRAPRGARSDGSLNSRRTEVWFLFEAPVALQGTLCRAEQRRRKCVGKTNSGAGDVGEQVR